ncbi:MAG TPA: hypothetical protein VM029_17005 [Opitutaceae bacterium]|nr:hypothetical protein [Opitutaceae bacterium]
MTIQGAVAFIIFFATSCQRTARYDEKVTAETAADFGRWQRDVQGSFKPAEWAEFEAALQDIKVRIIAHKEASGAAGVNDALRPKIHGRTVRDVLRQGYEAKLWRLNVELTELEKMIKGNATLQTNPGDSASSDYLARKLRDQADRFRKVEEEIRAAEEAVKGLAARV